VVSVRLYVTLVFSVKEVVGALAYANLVATYLEMQSWSPVDSTGRFRKLWRAEMTAETLSWMCRVNVILLVCSGIHRYWNHSTVSNLSCLHVNSQHSSLSELQDFRY
jgi:hypothetical protein